MKRIYLDHAATTPVDPRVKKAMESFWAGNFGNPSSLYKEGRDAKRAINIARADIAKIIGARPEEIIFTSGGTESNNLAIFGVVGFDCFNFSRLNPKGSDAGSKSKRFNPHIITTKIEHHSVLNQIKFLEKNGFDVTWLDVGKEGVIDPKDVGKALKPNTILVSIMYANNEIGTIQPIKEIGKILRKHKARLTDGQAVFHTDACQAAGYLDLNVEKLGVDLMTVNGSKMYGPKGVGFLYVKKNTKLAPIMCGGEQEKGLRPGTENVPAIIGLAEAFKIAQKEKNKEVRRLTILRDYFIERITKEIQKVFLNGHAQNRLPNNVNISILGTEGEAVVLYLDEYGISCSTGSACSSASLEPSHVIMALKKPHEYGHGSLRFTLGRKTTKKEIDCVMKILPKVVAKLRSISAIKV
ncbi:MAG: cysteine desulfurase family protein [Candidatus Paceibacterota bacterium]